jgi:hypothetical protein
VRPKPVPTAAEITAAVEAAGVQSARSSGQSPHKVAHLSFQFINVSLSEYIDKGR